MKKISILSLSLIAYHLSLASAVGTCACGVVPERQNDFYWENDKFGMRAYGPGEFHKWSGLDVFNKLPDAGSVGLLLKEHDHRGNWHVVPSDGILDNYAVGAGRGCGGVAMFADGEWKTYPNWESYEIITNTPEKIEFKLVYPAFSQAGKMTYHITMEKGWRWFKNEVSFEHPFQGARVGPGLDLSVARLHEGDVFEAEDRALVSLYEASRGEIEGSSMSAIWLAPEDTKDVKLMTDHQGCRILTLPGDRASFTYYAAANWSKRGEIMSAEKWHEAALAWTYLTMHCCELPRGWAEACEKRIKERK